MNKRILTFIMLFALIFSSLSIFATETPTTDDTPGTTETPGGSETPGEPATTTLTVENASFTLEKNKTLTENLPTIENETDLKYIIVSQPTHGTLTKTDDTTRSFSYTPDTDYTGTDTFTFKITKGAEESNTATITLTISEASTEPEDPEEPETLTVPDASYTLEENSILTANLPILENETNLKYVIVSQPTHGTLTHSDETSPSFSYTPTLDYTGTDSFTFKVTKDTAESNIATVTLTIEKEKTPVIPFTYVDMQNHWANYSASHLAARGLIVGEEIGSRYYFYPEREMTRGDFLLFLLAITESNEDATLEIPKVTFADSDKTPDWLIEGAKLAYAKGIIKGSAEGNSIYLNAYSPLTRTEAVVMINNVLKPANSKDDLKYSDLSSIPEWGLQAVKNLTSYEIIQGSENKFDPNSIITRGQAAEICFKLIKQLEKDAMLSNTDVTDIK